MSQFKQRTNNNGSKAEGTKAATLHIADLAPDLNPDSAEADDAEREIHNQRPPIAATRSFRMAKDDKTARLVIGFIGVVAVAFLMLVLFSQKSKPRLKKSGEANLGRPKVAETAPPSNDSIVPGGSMQPMQEDKRQPGQVNAHDVEKVKTGASDAVSNVAPNGGKNLAQIPSFPPPPSQGDNWTPPPYGQNHTEITTDKTVADGLAKPSLVFTAGDEKSYPAVNGENIAPTLDLGVGSRLSARLASVVTTAVDEPVVAIIEYGYQHDGQIIVPAGSKAVGSVRQADRSGYLQLHFDHLEMPDGSSVGIDALATDTDLGPLRGKVTGTSRGKNFAVRALTGVGQMSAMLVGQTNLNGAVSEADLVRMQMSENVGRAGDEEITRQMMMEHPIVTLPAGLRIYVVFEKQPEEKSGRRALGELQRVERGAVNSTASLQ
jgi:hypothetical protein